MIKSRKLKVVLLITLGIVLIFHILWYLNYSNFVTLNGFEKSKLLYIKDYDNYTISYNKPKYPNFSGNYSISNKSNELSYLLWPKNIFHGEKTGVSLYNSEDKINYLIYVDSNLNYIEGTGLDENQIVIVKKLLEKNKNELIKYKTILEKEINNSK